MSDKKKGFEVKWRVENILQWLQIRDDSLYSPQFLAVLDTRWKLKLCRTLHLGEKYISLVLERDVEDDNPKPVDLNYELSFLACNGLRLKSKSCKTKFSPKTASLHLNVNEVEILNEKREAYLPEGVLTVSCNLWMPLSKVFKGGCSIRSVIGKKCVNLKSSIVDFAELPKDSKVTVNFVSPYLDISCISFDVRLENNMLKFYRKKVECKSFNWYSCKFFLFVSNGEMMNCADGRSSENLLSLDSPCSFQINPVYSFMKQFGYLKNGLLTLQLEITYSPGIESECIEYDYNYKELVPESSVMENVCTYNSKVVVRSSPLENLHVTQHEDMPSDIEENESSDGDQYFGAAGKKNWPATTLKKDLTSLFESRLFCDTKLQTVDEIFPAHKSVLSARSPVFCKMLTTDMKEKYGECIDVPDVSSDTLRRMLQFIYTDCTGDLEMQSAKDLYIASDKYDIASLKHRCSSFMIKNLCPANVCEVIILAHMHPDKELESAAQEFVLTYDKEVFGSDEWKSFMRDFGSLAAKVMYLKCMKE